MKKLLCFTLCLVLLSYPVVASEINNKIEDETVNGSEPVGDYKFAEAYISVPYYSSINEKYYYSDNDYAGYIPLVEKKQIELHGERYWFLTYRGYVKSKSREW